MLFLRSDRIRSSNRLFFDSNCIVRDNNFLEEEEKTRNDFFVQFLFSVQSTKSFIVVFPIFDYVGQNKL